MESVDFVEAARFCNANGAHDTTIEAVRLGLRDDPEQPMLHVYRACAYDEFGRSQEAIADCERALQLDPRGPAGVLALITLALVRERIGDPAGALAAARAAIERDPAGRESHAVLGTLLAWHGAYPAAWPELECHWIAERVRFMQRFSPRTEWEGEPIAGKRLLLVHGQGLGDFIQMLRYIPRLHERGARVLLECPDALRELASDVPGIDAVVRSGSATPAVFDIYARAMSLARLCGEDGRHGGAPYLAAPAGARAAWSARLGPPDGRRRVGVVWAGNPAHENDRRRSIPLEALAPLADVAGVRWVSLQVGARAADAAPATFALERLDAQIATLTDTAAIIANLDLVIAADTAVAHLAGALGKPVWLALPWRPDWRWSRASRATPWYGSMRLFHADEPAWTRVVEQLAAELEQFPAHA